MALILAGSEKVAEHGSGARRHSGHFVGRQGLKNNILQKKKCFLLNYNSVMQVFYALANSITLVHKNQRDNIIKVKYILLIISCRQERLQTSALVGTQKKSRTLARSMVYVKQFGNVSASVGNV